MILPSLLQIWSVEGIESEVRASVVDAEQALVDEGEFVTIDKLCCLDKWTYNPTNHEGEFSCIQAEVNQLERKLIGIPLRNHF